MNDAVSCAWLADCMSMWLKQLLAMSEMVRTLTFLMLEHEHGHAD